MDDYWAADVPTATSSPRSPASTEALAETSAVSHSAGQSAWPSAPRPIPLRPPVPRDAIEAAVATGQTLRLLGFVLVAMGFLGVLLSAAYLSNLLAAATGAVLLTCFRNDLTTRQLAVTGLSVAACDHPRHAYCLTVTNTAVSVLSLVYCIWCA